MEFGKVLRYYRDSYKYSINKMAKMADISAPYVRKLEKQTNLIPSKQILYKIIYAFRNDEDKESPHELIHNFINAYLGVTSNEIIGDKSEVTQDYKLLFNEYMNVEKDFQSKEQVPYLVGKEDIYNNFITVNNDMKIDGLMSDEEHAHYDIENLLNQKKYKLMYGRELKLNNEKGLLYNVINDEDKEIIKKLIEAYLKTKYEKIKDPRDYFETIFNDLYKTEKLKNEYKDTWW